MTSKTLIQRPKAMNTRVFSPIALLTAILVTTCFCPLSHAKLIDITTDAAGAYNLSAENLDVTIAGTTVHAMVYRDRSPSASVPVPADGIPILVMRLTPGQMVTCNFTNQLSDTTVPEGASIHWHGIELDNDSDGTAVTQDSVKSGQRYTYRFIAPRPGIYWFHSHMVPGDTLWAGMYGIMIVTSPCETALIPSVLPNASATFTLAMTDIEYLTAPYTNTAGPLTGAVYPTGSVGRTNGGVFQTINKWIEDCAINGNNCGVGSAPGDTVLVNGYNPDTTPAPLTFNVQAGQVIRMQLLDEALTRTFNLSFEPTNTQLIYRIGGQGGLLNNARKEGGVQNSGGGDAGWNTFYDAGTILLSSGMRADTVTTIPTNAVVGSTITLWAEPLTIPNTPWPLSKNITNHYPIAFFKVIAGAPANNPPPIVDGTQILPGTGSCQVTSLTNGASNIKTNFMAPPPGYPGTNSGTIRLTQNGGPKPSIDGLNISAHNVLDGNMGNGEAWTKSTPLLTDRYAHVGDLYVLSVRNETGTGTGSTTLAHPFHLHGWSMQPLAMYNNAGVKLYTFNYNEFLDTIEVYGGQTYVFSVQLDDHKTFCDSSSGTPPTPGPILRPCTSSATGGALGKWLYHCHIGAHGVIGMMGEIILIDDAPQQVVWNQPPNLTTNGVDVLATKGAASQTVADDFRTNGPFTSISIWGSWTNDIVDPNAAFEIKFWTDVPTANGPFSRPGWQAWRQMFAAGTYTNFLVASNIINETFYNPAGPSSGTDTKVYRYDFRIPLNQAFSPIPGNTNWISVTAYTSTNTAFFGWKSCVTNSHYNDDGAWSSTLYGPPWTDLHYPAGNIYAPASMELAFTLSIPAPPGPREAPIAVPVLTVTITDGNVNISWTNGGILQSADDPSGPWTDIGGIPNPYVAPANAPHQFYRVRVPQ